MKIGQILLPGASAYEAKSQRIDFEILSAGCPVEILSQPLSTPSALRALLRDSAIDVLHVYGNPGPHAAQFTKITIPWVTSVSIERRRFLLRAGPPPSHVASPLTDPPLPEAVEALWFDGTAGLTRPGRDRYRIGTYGANRPGVSKLVAQTVARLSRFRDDLDWMMFDAHLSPTDLTGIDLWVDPATSPDDFDGFTAEAMVAGRAVVACRTPVNAIRFRGGGFLVPLNDPNELAHAVVTALFKDEIAEERLRAASREAPRFRPSARAHELLRLYNRIIDG